MIISSSYLGLLVHIMRKHGFQLNFLGGWRMDQRRRPISFTSGLDERADPWINICVTIHSKWRMTHSDEKWEETFVLKVANQAYIPKWTAVKDWETIQLPIMFHICLSTLDFAVFNVILVASMVTRTVCRYNFFTILLDVCRDIQRPYSYLEGTLTIRKSCWRYFLDWVI